MVNQRATKKQQELLQFIDGFIKGNGYGPSYREVMRALGYKSVSTVATHIDQLILKGYLDKTDNSARSLSVITLRDHDVAAENKHERLVVKKYIERQLDKLQDSEQKDILLAAATVLNIHLSDDVIA